MVVLAELIRSIILIPGSLWCSQMLFTCVCSINDVVLHLTLNYRLVVHLTYLHFHLIGLVGHDASFMTLRGIIDRLRKFGSKESLFISRIKLHSSLLITNGLDKLHLLMTVLVHFI